MKTLQQLNEVIAEKGDKIALVAMTKEKAKSWTYNQLLQESEKLAHGLIHRGLKKGERVAIIGEESASWLIACLAIIRSGGICIPIDNQFTNKQLKQVLENSKPSSAFVTSKIKERIESLKLKETPDLILLDDDKEDEKLHWKQFKQKEKYTIEKVAPENQAVIFFTSGTTGAPKGVPLSHKNLLHQLESIRQLKLVTDEDHLLVPLPFHHVYPFIMGIFVPLYLGVRIILPYSLTSSQIKQALKEQDVTIVLGLPRLYRALLDGIDNRIDSIIWPVRPCLKSLMRLSTLLLKTLHLRLGRVLLFPLHQQFSPKLRMLISGGSPLSPEIAVRLEGLGWKILVGYGLTETSPLLTANTNLAKHRKSVGKAIEEVSLRISKKKKEEIGEVEAKGPNVFEGYLEAPEKTKKAFTEDGWFRTGDRGKIDEEGFLYLEGRVSTLIVTESGENIQPEDVEDAYQEHSAIKEIGILERDGKLVAVVVPEAKVKDKIRDTLKKALEEIADDLPSYQHLTHFEISKSAIPRTRLQKIRRKELQALYDKLQEGDQKEKAKPVSIKEMSEEDQALLEDKAAKKTWEMLVKRYPKQPLSPDSHFSLDLGVDSIDWLNLSLEIADCCQIEITEEHISQIEAVRDLLKIIAEESPEETNIKKEDILEKPESVLDKKEQAWLSPLNPAMQYLARIGYSLNRFIIRFYFRLKVTGKIDFPEDNLCIIASNHSSYLDPMVLAAALDNRTLLKVRWAGLADIMLSNPIMRFISRLARVAPINPRRGAQSSLAFGALILKKEESLIWFPEGGRSPDGKLQDFQPGIGMLAEHFKPIIIPVYIQGSYEALPVGGLWPRPHRIHIHFGKPQNPAELEKKGDGKERYQRISDGFYKYMKRMAAQVKD